MSLFSVVLCCRRAHRRPWCVQSFSPSLHPIPNSHWCFTLSFGSEEPTTKWNPHEIHTFCFIYTQTATVALLWQISINIINICEALGSHANFILNEMNYLVALHVSNIKIVLLVIIIICYRWIFSPNGCHAGCGTSTASKRSRREAPSSVLKWILSEMSAPLCQQ